MRSQAIPLYLFAKAPVAGKAKKRLCPPLTPKQAAQVAAGLLTHATRRVESGWPGCCVLSVTPDLEHPAFIKCKQSEYWQTTIQPQANLGERMRNALQAGIDQAGRACVLGTDIPGISATILSQTQVLLAAGDNVVGPTDDGGFYLLGLNQMPKALFDQIEWGSDKVYSRLSQNARMCGISLTVLPQLSDCDYFEDLCRAAEHVPAFARALSEAGFNLAILKA